MTKGIVRRLVVVALLGSVALSYWRGKADHVARDRN
jgi:hypothetical protein